LGRKKNKGALSVAVCSGKPAGLYDPDGVAIVTFGGAGIGERSLRSQQTILDASGRVEDIAFVAPSKDSWDSLFRERLLVAVFLDIPTAFWQNAFRKAMAGHGFLKGVDSVCAEFTDVPARIHGQLEQTKEQRKEINL